MSLPRVSCIVAAHNYARFLRVALDSALASDYPQEMLEIVVVDDGSTDDTPQVVEPYLDRIRYVRKPNGGLLSTVNRGLAEATGELIAFLSADDTWPPDKVRKQAELLAANPHVGLVYSDMELIDDSGARVAPSYFRAKGVTPLRGRVLGPLMRHCFIAGGSLMVRASLKERFHPIPPHAAWEDWWIALRAAEVAEVDYIDEPLYGYRTHGSNMFLDVGGGERMLRLLREDAPWRRWLLTNVDPDRDDVSADDFLHCYQLFAAHADRVAAETGEPLERLIPPDERSHEALAAALAAADPAARTKRLVRALALDPWNADARAALAGAPRVRQPAPAVTCLVTTHDYERFLPRALDSVLAQRYPAEALDVVVVDDGSTDSTPELMRGYGDRVRYVRQPNRGVIAAVDRGLDEARGELIALLDADDMWPPDKLALQSSRLAERPDAGLVYGDMEVIDADDRSVHLSFMTMTGLTAHTGRVLGRLVCRNFVTTGAIVMRASLRERIQPIDPIAAYQDWWIALRAAEVAPIDYVPASVCRYRQHGANTVLGVNGGPPLHRLLRERELPFRRWMIDNVDHAALSAEDLLEAHSLLLARAAEVVRGEGLPLADVLPVAPGDRDRAQALRERAAEALRNGERAAAIKLLVQASALDPRDAATAAALDAARGAPAIPGARRFTTLAFADEVLADPRLLESYGRAFGGGDDATLVVAAPGFDPGELLERLGAALAASGIGDDGADVLALPGADTRALSERVDAVLSASERAGAPPRFDHADAGGLRALAERRWHP